MERCTTTVRPGAVLQEELDRGLSGTVLCLEPGRYRGGLRVSRSVTIRSQPGGEVVLESEGQGGVIHVVGDAIRVVLEGLTLTGGNWSNGSAVAVTGSGADVVLRGCTIARNQARTKWLGAVIVVLHNNRPLGERCRVLDVERDDESGPGQAVVVTHEGGLVVKDSLLVGRARKGGSLVTVREGARVAIERSTLVNEGDGRVLEVFGTTTDRRAVTLLDSIVSGGEAIRAEMVSNVLVDRSVLHGDVVGPVTLGEDVRRADPAFEKRDPEPWQPSATSPAVGLARGGGARDLTGRARLDVRATAGAFER